MALDAQNTILRNRAMGCSDAPNTAEILPGEILCADNLIRRETASEVTGNGRYSAGKAYGSEKLADLCALYSIMTSAENLRGLKSQSTPEELCAWLNDMPKRSFMLSVMTEGDDKIVLPRARQAYHCTPSGILEDIPARTLEVTRFDPLNRHRQSNGALLTPV